MKKNILNYRFEIFPTRQQQSHLFSQFRKAKIQWNHACRKRKKLMSSLKSGHLEYVLTVILSEERNNNQGVRRAAIAKFREENGIGAEYEEILPDLYDIFRRFWKALIADDKIELLGRKKSEIGKEKDKTEKARKKAEYDRAVIKVKAEICLRYINDADGDIKEIVKAVCNDLKTKREKEIIQFRQVKSDFQKAHAEASEKYNQACDKAKKENKKQPVFRKPKRKESVAPVWWAFIECINQYAGWNANRFIKNSYKNKRGTATAVVYDAVTGSAKSMQWKTATNPTPEQRKYGAAGEPQWKRRVDSISYAARIQPGDLITGGEIDLTFLPKGLNRVKIAQHRIVPGRVQKIVVSQDGERFWVTLSAEVKDSDYCIIPMQEGWQAGIDPGQHDFLTIGYVNVNTGELKNQTVNFSTVEQSGEKLAKLQQKIAEQQGAKRKLTSAEKQEKIDIYIASDKFNRMTAEKQKEILKKYKYDLERQYVWRESRKPSNRWLKTKKKISAIHLKKKFQRRAIHHEIAHKLATECDVVVIGSWEPPRVISYRKQLKELKQQVRLGVPGAKEELKALQDNPTKNSKQKGIVKKRERARDMAIASFRALVKEKSDRSGIVCYEKSDESYTTMTCCVCGDQTGPKKDLSVREWTCSECGVLHKRDVNAAYNILMKKHNVSEILKQLLNN